MKYWRGYLVAAIVAACSWGLATFAQTHSELVDMIYPYVTRMIQSYMAQWSADVVFCVWQALVLVLIVVGLASVVLMIVLRWNPIQWAGWVLAVLCTISFANTAVYGLNNYSSPLAEDIQLEDAQYRYSVSELEDAAIFYRDKANELSRLVKRAGSGEVSYPEFSQLAQQAGEGFKALTYSGHAVFAGSTLPVKELGWSGFFAARGIAGMTVPLTGEAAVNPKTPVVIQPYVICREMARRMCISTEQDANFAAFLACDANSSVDFQYAAYLMAYRYCYDLLESLEGTSQQFSLHSLQSGEGAQLKHDLEVCADFFGSKENMDQTVCDLLVVWHIQEYVLPLIQEEEEEPFDPYDESVVDLTGLVRK